MHLSVIGSRSRVHGEVQVPNSKYHAHRALILAALAEGVSHISGLSDARHVEYTVAMLRSLGIQIEVDHDTFIVHGGRFHPRTQTVTAGSSGTTLYFMVGLASLADTDVVVTGQKYFLRRPIGPLLDALNQLGVDAYSATRCPPIQVHAKRPVGGTAHIAGTLSQWLSGLLLLAPFAREHTTIIVDGELNERTYVELTVRMMGQFGLSVTVSDDGKRYDIEPNQTAVATDLMLPPDIGSAAFGLAVAALHPADIVLHGLKNTSAVGIDHPEAEFLDIISRMGLPMEYDRRLDGVRVQHDGIRLRGTEVDCRDAPDMLPVLSALAAVAEGDSVLHHVDHVRLKESDRVVAMLQLNGMGGRLDFDGDDLTISGVESLTSGHLSSFNDHRVLMSLAVAASAAEGRSSLTYPNAYRISYPRFLEAMRDLNVDMRVEPGPAKSQPVRVRSTPPPVPVAIAEEMTGPAWVRYWAKKQPNRLAVVAATPDRTDYLRWAELDELADRAATLFLRLGVSRGDRVAVQLPNCQEFVIAAVAAMRIGAVICPIMPIFRQRELAFALKRSAARILIVPDSYRGRRYDREAAELLESSNSSASGAGLTIEHVLVVHQTRQAYLLPPKTNASWQDWNHAIADVTVDQDALAAREPGPDDAAQLLFTSGTSGEPKGVIHTHRRLSRATQMEVEHLGLTPRDTVFIPSPLAHQTGFLYGMWLAFTLGTAQILQSTWDAPRALEVLRGWEGTFVQAATPFLTDLVREVEGGAVVPRSLRIFVATGAAVPRALAERATRVLGCAVCGAFGTTETGLGTLASPHDSPARAWGTDGRALPGVSIRIVDDAGAVLPENMEGHFELTGPTVFDGYLDRADLSEEAFTADGWYRTGDLAVLDEDGYVRITGRVRDIINRGGEKIPVSEIEQLLYRHPAIDDVAIVAMPDPRLGERACAFVVLGRAAHLTFADMQRFLDENLVAKQYWPERLELIEEIPRNAVGKVQKFVLRERAALFQQQFNSLANPAKEMLVHGTVRNNRRRPARPDRSA